MLRRARLPVLAEIGGEVPEGARAWSLRRTEHERLAGVLPRLGERRALLVAGDGEAPCQASVAIASAAAAGGRRTVLVECDLKRPRLAGLLGLLPEPGLHEYLRWEAQPGEILQPLLLAGPAAAGVQEPLACVCGGREAADAETLLGLGSFLHAVSKLRRAYELVVFAGPSIAADPTALQTVARQADAVIGGLPGADAVGREGSPIRAAIRRLPVPALGCVAVGSADS
jgi:Mrp family chromosome partitioning ATPase